MKWREGSVQRASHGPANLRALEGLVSTVPLARPIPIPIPIPSVLGRILPSIAVY